MDKISPNVIKKTWNPSKYWQLNRIIYHNVDYQVVSSLIDIIEFNKTMVLIFNIAITTMINMEK